MAFVALKRLRFGDGYLLPGDEVPIEDGRNYDAALHLGEIAEMDSVAAMRAELEKVTAERDEALGRVAELEKAGQAKAPARSKS